MFNFAMPTTSELKTSGNKMLAPWAIHENVEFTGIELTSFKGKKDPNAEYQQLVLHFKGESGSFDVKKFVPNKDEDFERRSYDRDNGSKGYFASNAEEIMEMIAQTVFTLNNAKYEKLSEVIQKCQTFKEVFTAVEKVLKPVVGTKTKLKLVGRVTNGKTYPEIPQLARVNDNQEKYTGDFFIGDKVAFNTWELNKIKEYQESLNAKPTNMGTVDNLGVDEAPAGNDDDLDLAGL